MYTRYHSLLHQWCNSAAAYGQTRQRLAYEVGRYHEAATGLCILVAILSYTSDAIPRPPTAKRASDSLMRWVGTMKLLLVTRCHSLLHQWCNSAYGRQTRQRLAYEVSRNHEAATGLCILVAILSYTSDAIPRPPTGKRASDSPWSRYCTGKREHSNLVEICSF